MLQRNSHEEGDKAPRETDDGEGERRAIRQVLERASSLAPLVVLIGFKSAPALAYCKTWRT
ncbi:MAG TPA: hypothetical protein VL361_26775 [Candidatus Limnocylindrales bacterium]|jgi:hypothetical protein|nr:hypothetical protein [Candidatus Limnocylindrales bacterium]